jgi:hypothetical protein
MALEEIILKELRNGPATVRELTMRLEHRVRVRLDVLRAHQSVVREWKTGHQTTIYRLPEQPNAQRQRIHARRPTDGERDRARSGGL